MHIENKSYVNRKYFHATIRLKGNYNFKPVSNKYTAFCAAPAPLLSSLLPF